MASNLGFEEPAGHLEVIDHFDLGIDTHIVLILLRTVDRARPLHEVSDEPTGDTRRAHALASTWPWSSCAFSHHLVIRPVEVAVSSQVLPGVELTQSSTPRPRGD
jgi:hypothetical protein